jgi:NAD(P)-dependent dehydrogenase (short-subunit alcohol dehydrogenase family)
MEAVKETIMILVTGATGTVGRQVVTQLREQDVPVRAVTRDPASARLPAGVEVVRGEVTGRAVRWEELPPEEGRRQLLAAWGDPGFVDSALATWAGMVTQPEPVTRTVEEITGAPARTFRQRAADHASDFRPLSVAEVADRYVSAFRAGTASRFTKQTVSCSLPRNRPGRGFLAATDTPVRAV